MKAFPYYSNLIVTILFFAFLKQVSAENDTKPNEQGPWPGLEVNTYNGNLFYQRIDLQIPARHAVPLDLIFSYNSLRSAIDKGYGNGWSFNFGMWYEISGNTFTIGREEGEEDRFTWTGTTWFPGVGEFATLLEYEPGKYRFTTKYGIRYYFDDPAHKQLTGIEDRNGNTHVLAYTSGKLTTLTDPSGRMLNLTWIGSHLAQIEDPNTLPARAISFNYDGNGNMVQVTRPLSNTFSYSYDENRNMVSVNDPNSGVVVISYDPNQAVSSISCPYAGSSKSFDYESCDNATMVNQIVSMINRQTVYTFDMNGRVINKQFPDGNEISYTYDNQDNITSFTDENGVVTSYTWDSQGNMLSETDCQGYSKSSTYETTFNKVISFTNQNSNTTTYSYDLNGNHTGTYDCLGNAETLTYDAYGNIVTTTDKNGSTTSFFYDIYGNLTSLLDPLGFTESYTYDGVGNMLTKTDKRGYATTYSYDALDRHIGTLDALGYTRSYSYDANGNLVSETDQNSFSSLYVYDILNRMSSSIDAMLGTTLYYYDEAGNIVAETNTNGCTTWNNFNNRNWRTSTTDELGGMESFTYDATGNMLSLMDKGGNTTTYSYDCLGRLMVLTDPGGFSETYVYDPVGNKTSLTDKNNHTTIYGYDCLDRHVSTTYPMAYTEYTSYDPMGRKISFTDRNNQITTYAYNSMGRLISETDPLLLTQTLIYDGEGNMLSSTDKNGNTTSYTYDALSRRTMKTDPLGNSEGYSYDGIGNRLTFTDKRGYTTTYEFDGLNRFLSSTSPMGYVESNTYDAMGNKTSTTNKNGHTTYYTYDCNNQNTTVTDPLGFSEFYTYSPAGHVIAYTDKNGNTTTWDYSCCRLMSMTDPLLFNESYGYDPAGNRTGITDKNGNTTTHQYDNLNRLISVTKPSLNQTLYTYDGVGNVLTRTDADLVTTGYIYNARHELTTTFYPDLTGINNSYDNNGNLIQTIRTGGVGEMISYSYDQLNRLISKITDFGGVFIKTITYSNDQNGNCISTVSESGTIIYLYDADNRVIQVTDQNSQVTSFEYDGIGNQTAVHYPNGVSTYYTYDGADQVIEVVTTNAPLLVESVMPKSRPGPPKANDVLLTIDCGVMQLLSPVSGPGLTETEPVTVLLMNYGTQPVFTGAVASYSIDGGPVFSQPVFQPLFPGNPIPFTFAQPADLSIPGHAYQIMTCLDVPGDMDPSNNCLMATVLNVDEGPSVYQSFQYQYDPMGNVIFILIDEGVEIIDFQYSSRNELVHENFFPSGNFNHYTYTPTGKRASKNENGNLSVYEYNIDDILLLAGDISYEVNNNGDRISKTDGVETTLYQYGFEHELTRITLPDLSVEEYTYDPFGRRIRENIAGVETNLLSFDREFLEVWDAIGTLQTYYNPGLSITTGSSTGYYHYNGFGSSTLLTDPAATVLAEAGFDAFGTLIHSTGTWMNDNLIFNGWDFDPELILLSDGIYIIDPETGVGHLAESFLPKKTKTVEVTEVNKPETVQEGDKKKDEKKKSKCCGVKKFVVKWSKPSGLYVGQMATIDTEIEFLNDDEHDPACCLFCQNVMTVAEITDGPGKGWKVDTSPMHDDNYSRGDDSDGKPELSDPGFKTDDNPGISGLDPKDVVDYSFTAEQIVKEGCDSPCPKGKVVAKRGPHTVTVKGAEPRVWTGVPETLDK